MYPAGECTNYAWSRAGYLGTANLGNALTWASRWKALGHDTTMVPTAGTVACFQPGVEGALGTGHVAYVESVQPDGSFTITEMNCGGCGSPPGGFGKVDTRRGLKPSLGLSFLLPPAGSTMGGTGSLTATPAGLQTAPVKSSSVLGALGDLTGISGLIGTIINGGEVVFGGVLALVGLYFLAKDTAAGQAVGAVAKTASPAVKIASDLAPGKAGKAVRAAKAPTKAASSYRRESDRQERVQARDQEREERTIRNREGAVNEMRLRRSLSGTAKARRVGPKPPTKRQRLDAAYAQAKTASKPRPTVNPKEIPF